MNPKLKAGLIITVTFIAGILVGALGSGAYLSTKYKQSFSTQQMRDFFINDLERTISPEKEKAAAVREILQRTSQKISDVRTQHSDEMRDVIAQMKTDLSPLLSKEQMDRLEKKLSRMNSHAMHPRGPQIGMLLEMKKELSLTEDQIRKLNDIGAEIRKQMIGSDSLRPPHAMMEEMEKYRHQVDSLLTKEQREKMRQLWKNRKDEME